MNTVLNITIVVILLLVAVGTYLHFTTGSVGPLDFNPAGVSQEAVANTQQFVLRREVLDQISLNFDIFDNPQFFQTIAFTEPIGTYPIGRENIFSPVEEGQSESSVNIAPANDESQ